MSKWLPHLPFMCRRACIHSHLCVHSRKLHSKTTVNDPDEGSKISYLHNALGQRVFKSEPQVDHVAPSASALGQPFIDWLRINFGWMFAQAQFDATLGQAYIYDDAQLGSTPVLLGEYGNGGGNPAGRSEYIWLPTEDGQAIPIGLYKEFNLSAIHSDHLGTPRRITNWNNNVDWQWPYSAFGEDKPVSTLTATTDPILVYTTDPATNTQLQAWPSPVSFNLRFAGQYFDSESQLNYNYFRSYQASQGRYTQSDPIGLGGGLNRFEYVEGSPLSFFDPFGLCQCTAVGTKEAFKFDKWIGDERLVRGDYQCKADDGKESKVKGSHTERYFTSHDDGRRGNLLGQTYVNPPSFVFGRGASYSQKGFQSFDPLGSKSPELSKWANACGCK